MRRFRWRVRSLPVLPLASSPLPLDGRIPPSHILGAPEERIGLGPLGDAAGRALGPAVDRGHRGGGGCRRRGLDEGVPLNPLNPRTFPSLASGEAGEGEPGGIEDVRGTRPFPDLAQVIGGIRKVPRGLRLQLRSPRGAGGHPAGRRRSPGQRHQPLGGAPVAQGHLEALAPGTPWGSRVMPRVVLANERSATWLLRRPHKRACRQLSTTAAHDERKGRLVPKMASARYGLMAPSRQKWS